MTTIHVSPDCYMLNYFIETYPVWLGMFSLDRSMIIDFVFCDEMPEPDQMDGLIVIKH